MEKIELIILGNLHKLVDIKRIKNKRSKLFKISEIRSIPHISDIPNDSQYLNVELSKENIQNIVGKPNNIIRIIITNYELERNFYINRIDEKTCVISTRNVLPFLQSQDISTDNFIITKIYYLLSIYLSVNNLTSNKEVYELLHYDTRGCLFDFNGDLSDVIFNTEQPIICSECRARLLKKNLPEKYLENLEKELIKIKKPLLLRFELFVKKYTLISILLTTLLTTLLGIFINIVSVEAIKIINKKIGHKKEHISSPLPSGRGAIWDYEKPEANAG
ncbi:MAG: hypothetical protein ABIH39_05440 [Candidatus Margulisiibacteriota bacterium]